MAFAYLGGNQRMYDTIESVVEALPPPVRRFVSESICFTGIGEYQGNGATWRMRHVFPAFSHGDGREGQWLIVLGEDGILEEPDRGRHTIRHEIAHAFLGDDGSVPHEEIDELAHAWEKYSPERE